ncbi:hypothetical protein M9458_051209, partial [Cirrhinus mrigala]
VASGKNRPFAVTQAVRGGDRAIRGHLGGEWDEQAFSRSRRRSGGRPGHPRSFRWLVGRTGLPRSFRWLVGRTGLSRSHRRSGGRLGHPWSFRWLVGRTGLSRSRRRSVGRPGHPRSFRWRVGRTGLPRSRRPPVGRSGHPRSFRWRVGFPWTAVRGMFRLPVDARLQLVRRGSRRLSVVAGAPPCGRPRYRAVKRDPGRHRGEAARRPVPARPRP